MIRKYQIVLILCTVFVFLSVPHVSATPFIKIDPISDKYQSENFAITGTTDLPFGKEVRIDIIPSQCTATQKQLVQQVYNAYHNLPQQKLPDSCSEMTGASAIVKVTKGDPFNVNTISMDVSLSSFSPGNYQVLSMGSDIDASSETKYFTVLKGSPPETAAPAVPSTPAIPALTNTPGTTIPPVSGTTPTQPGFDIMCGLLGFGIITLVYQRINR